ncbi:helix-turn-helix domain-containing protein [Algoriphagus sp. PAP.12]|uniref:helix-turn-helix domain-containing protein n=1 Tax=Algoriphagus sp. PAP.12 TaxID=2996678 RepID=UPI00227D4A1B|nr:helix-turn-helix transcriptional regulator [Algoriphagus sp. PAP.12]
MNWIAKRISEARKLKGLSQEQLAEQAKINLRTIQRIEKSECEPRGSTLNLICDALEIDSKELITSEESFRGRNVLIKIVNGLFLVALNLILMGVIGFLTYDISANLNSKFGGFLISVFLPFSIVAFTKDLSGIERMVKFGTGYFAYFILVMTTNGFARGFISGLFPCLLISLAVLYFGGRLLKNKD